MKILLFGNNGQVGWELNRSLQPLGEVIALSREDADFSDPESLRKIVREARPDVIVNAVAYTSVDKVEAEEEFALVVNAQSPGVLAEEAQKTNALLIHYSTDYVFDGKKKEPYTEQDETNPVNAYGRTKLAGELAIKNSGCDYLIFRTSWVYASRGHNFLLTILKLAKERSELSIVADQYGSPTSAEVIADVTALAISMANINGIPCGTYHLTAAGKTTWYDFSCYIVERAISNGVLLALQSKQVNAITTEEYPLPANRPVNSCMSTVKLSSVLDIPLLDWKVNVNRVIDQLTKVDVTA